MLIVHQLHQTLLPCLQEISWTICTNIRKYTQLKAELYIILERNAFIYPQHLIFDITLRNVQYYGKWRLFSREAVH